MARSLAPGAGSVDPADHPSIAFDDGSWKWFCERIQALGLPPAEEFRQQFEMIYGHLQGVNTWLNLTRVDGDQNYLLRHVLDSLMLFRCPWFRDADALACCDLGSGGGYPGLPLALLEPAHRWLLVDSRQRKVRFLQAAGALIDAQRVTSRAFRGSEVAKWAPDEMMRYDVVTTRATGSVLTIAGEAQPLLRLGGRLVVWQGPSFDAEAEQNLRAELPHSAWTNLTVDRYTLVEDDPMRCLITLTLQRGR